MFIRTFKEKLLFVAKSLLVLFPFVSSDALSFNLNKIKLPELPGSYQLQNQSNHFSIYHQNLDKNITSRSKFNICSKYYFNTGFPPTSSFIVTSKNHEHYSSYATELTGLLNETVLVLNKRCREFYTSLGNNNPTIKSNMLEVVKTVNVVTYANNKPRFVISKYKFTLGQEPKRFYEYKAIRGNIFGERTLGCEESAVNSEKNKHSVLVNKLGLVVEGPYQFQHSDYSYDTVSVFKVMNVCKNSSLFHSRDIKQDSLITSITLNEVIERGKTKHERKTISATNSINYIHRILTDQALVDHNGAVTFHIYEPDDGTNNRAKRTFNVFVKRRVDADVVLTSGMKNIIEDEVNAAKTKHQEKIQDAQLALSELDKGIEGWEINKSESSIKMTRTSKENNSDVIFMEAYCATAGNIAPLVNFNVTVDRIGGGAPAWYRTENSEGTSISLKINNERSIDVYGTHETPKHKTVYVNTFNFGLIDSERWQLYQSEKSLINKLVYNSVVSNINWRHGYIEDKGRTITSLKMTGSYGGGLNYTRWQSPDLAQPYNLLKRACYLYQNAGQFFHSKTN